jgi:hypothetical protein
LFKELPKRVKIRSHEKSLGVPILGDKGDGAGLFGGAFWNEIVSEASHRNNGSLDIPSVFGANPAAEGHHVVNLEPICGWVYAVQFFKDIRVVAPDPVLNKQSFDILMPCCERIKSEIIVDTSNNQMWMYFLYEAVDIGF